MTGTEVELMPTEDAPSMARHALKAALEREGVPVSVLGRLLLITSEIVTTALTRPASDAAEPVRLNLDVDRRRVRIEVIDPRPRRRAGGRFTRAQYGMSFVILDRLSDRWGVMRGTDHSEAWSEVDLDDPATGLDPGR